MLRNVEQRNRLYSLLSLGLLFILVVVGICTIRDYGMGWDEVTRWNSGDAKVDYYKALFTADDPLEVVRSTPSDNYPGFFDISLSLLHQVTGWDRFLLGHWQAFVFGLAGLMALWRIGWIFGGARLGFWSVVLMILVPTFYGHWFHNPKDVPFAATYTLGLWTLIECFRRYPVLRKRWLLAAAVASGLCMATRIAGMVLLAYFAAGVGLIVLIHFWDKRESFCWKESLRTLGPWVLALPLVAFGAYLMLLPWWPGAHKDLLSVSGSTLQQLHVSASEIPLFFRGEIMWAADAPHDYTLWMFAIKAPEVLLVGLVLAFPLAWFHLREHVAGGGDFKRIVGSSILILGGFFPLLYLTLTAPALHNGARHFLFAFPALCVCAAWAYLKASDWIGRNRPKLRPVAYLVFAALLVLPLFHLVRLHPYQYIYYNSLVGGPSGAYGSYEGEYWFTSTKHAVERLEDLLETNPRIMPDQDKVRLFILGPWQVAEPFLPDNFQLTGDLNGADFMILNTQMLVHKRFEGEEVFSIERMGMPVCFVLRASSSLLENQ